MKIYQLKPETFLEQEINNRKIYLIFEKCDGAYGVFVEVNKNGDGPGESVYDRYKPIYYACFASLEDLNLKIIKEPEINIKERLNEFKTFIKQKTSKLLSSWSK